MCRAGGSVEPAQLAEDAAGEAVDEQLVGRSSASSAASQARKRGAVAAEPARDRQHRQPAGHARVARERATR